jgi:hypothetical protein
MRALAYALKGESLGEALQSYQRIPIQTFGVTEPTYVPRAEALPVVRALIDSAIAELAATPAQLAVQHHHPDAGREPAEHDPAVPRALRAHGER